MNNDELLLSTVLVLLTAKYNLVHAQGLEAREKKK